MDRSADISPPRRRGRGILLAFGPACRPGRIRTVQVGVMGATRLRRWLPDRCRPTRWSRAPGAVGAVISVLALNLPGSPVTASIRASMQAFPVCLSPWVPHLTTDENWALILAQRAKGRHNRYWYLVAPAGGLGRAGACAMAGVFFIVAIPDPKKSLGIDFAFNRAFSPSPDPLEARDLAPWLAARRGGCRRDPSRRPPLIMGR